MAKKIIFGDNNDNVLTGRSGNSKDKIVGLGGDDTIHGGAGKDIIWGDGTGSGSGSGSVEDSNEYLDGGAGSDKIFAGGGDDIVNHVEVENSNSMDVYRGEEGGTFRFDELGIKVNGFEDLDFDAPVPAPLPDLVLDNDTLGEEPDERTLNLPVIARYNSLDNADRNRVAVIDIFDGDEGLLADIDGGYLDNVTVELVSGDSLVFTDVPDYVLSIGMDLLTEELHVVLKAGQAPGFFVRGHFLIDCAHHFLTRRPFEFPPPPCQPFPDPLFIRLLRR